VDFSCKIAPLENYCEHTAFAPQMRLLIKRIKRGEGIPLGTRTQIMRPPLTSQPLWQKADVSRLLLQEILARITIQHTLKPETSNCGWVKIEKRINCEEERFLTFPILFQWALFT
jgi:hypothetical protein